MLSVSCSSFFFQHQFWKASSSYTWNAAKACCFSVSSDFTSCLSRLPPPAFAHYPSTEEISSDLMSTYLGKFQPWQISPSEQPFPGKVGGLEMDFYFFGIFFFLYTKSTTNLLCLVRLAMWASALEDLDSLTASQVFSSSALGEHYLMTSSLQAMGKSFPSNSKGCSTWLLIRF